MKYLVAAKDKPVAITKEQSDSKKAYVTPSFDEGEVFLRNQKGASYRLQWTKKDKARKRFIEPGTYRLTGYRIVNGKWFVSSTAGKKDLTLVAGKEAKLDIKGFVKVELKVQRNRGLRLQMQVTGWGETGISIYYKGKRISIPYVIEGNGKKAVASGVMKYG